MAISAQKYQALRDMVIGNSNIGGYNNTYTAVTVNMALTSPNGVPILGQVAPDFMAYMSKAPAGSFVRQMLDAAVMEFVVQEMIVQEKQQMARNADRLQRIESEINELEEQLKAETSKEKIEKIQDNLKELKDRVQLLQSKIQELNFKIREYEKKMEALQPVRQQMEHMFQRYQEIHRQHAEQCQQAARASTLEALAVQPNATDPEVRREAALRSFETLSGYMHVEGYRQQVESNDKGDQVMAIHQRYIAFQEERRDVKKDSSLSAAERKEKRENMKFELTDDEVKAIEDNLQAGTAELIAEMDSKVVRDGLDGDSIENQELLDDLEKREDSTLQVDGFDDMDDFMADLLGDDFGDNLPSNDVLEPLPSSAPALPEAMVNVSQERIFGAAMIGAWKKQMEVRQNAMPIGAALAGMLGHVEAYDAKPEVVEQLGQGSKVVNHGQNLSPKKMAAFQEGNILKRNYDVQVKAKAAREMDLRVMKKEEAAKLVSLANENDDMKAKMSGDATPKSVMDAYKSLQSSYSEGCKQARAERNELQSELSDAQQRLHDLSHADAPSADHSAAPRGPDRPDQ